MSVWEPDAVVEIRAAWVGEVAFAAKLARTLDAERVLGDDPRLLELQRAIGRVSGLRMALRVLGAEPLDIEVRAAVDAMIPSLEDRQARFMR